MKTPVSGSVTGQIPAEGWGSLGRHGLLGGGPPTHGLLSLPLVSLHFGLQLVHQVLEPEDVLAVLLGLQT